MIDCAIFDLDGTLANTSKRVHFLKKSPKDWQAFFSHIPDDEPVEYVIKLAQALQGTYKIIICTGRPNTYHEKTLAWLIRHRVPFDKIFERGPNDFRDDFIVKHEMLGQIRAAGYNPVFAIDDRPSVVDMWRIHGVPCFTVDQSSWVGAEKQ